MRRGLTVYQTGADPAGSPAEAGPPESESRRRALKALGGISVAGLGLAGGLFPGPGAEEPPAGREKPFRIDIHHHVASPGFIAEIRSRRTGQKPLEDWTPEQSLAAMDRGGVATAILSISEPGVWFGSDPAARALARECNDYGASLIARHAGRFGQFAILPMPDVEGSLREIDYALGTLKAEGVCMLTDYQGRFLGDPAFAPVFEELNRRKAVVYTHPARNDCCRNLVPDVAEPVIELGTDTTRTIASLLFSGTASRCPQVRFIFAHAGGTLPFLMQRMLWWARLRKDLAERMPEGVLHHVQRFYYDTASASTIYPLSSLTRLVPAGRILFGTDFPFLTPAETAANLRETGLFDAAALAAIERGNAAGLLGLG